MNDTFRDDRCSCVRGCKKRKKEKLCQGEEDRIHDKSPENPKIILKKRNVHNDAVA